MRKLLYALPLALGISGCQNSPQFVQDPSKYGSMEFCFIEEVPDSATAKPGDVLFLDMDYYTADGRKIYSSRDVSDNFRMYAPDTFEKGTIEQALMMMHKGDSAIFKVEAGPFFENTRKVKLPKALAYSELITFHIRLSNIYDGALYQKEIDEYNERMESQELMVLMEYLLNEKITAKPSPSGLYKIVTKEGKGTVSADGKNVTVHFVGSLIDGREFDNSYKRNEPFTFKLGEGKSIPGFEEGIASMRKGEKCRLIFPSTLGYGPRGVNGRIPAFATLIFDVELIDFE